MHEREDEATSQPSARPKARTGKPFLLWLPPDLQATLKAAAAHRGVAIQPLLVRAVGSYAKFIRRLGGRPVGVPSPPPTRLPSFAPSPFKRMDARLSISPRPLHPPCPTYLDPPCRAATSTHYTEDLPQGGCQRVHSAIRIAFIPATSVRQEGEGATIFSRWRPFCMGCRESGAETLGILVSDRLKAVEPHVVARQGGFRTSRLRDDARHPKSSPSEQDLRLPRAVLVLHRLHGKHRR